MASLLDVVLARNNPRMAGLLGMSGGGGMPQAPGAPPVPGAPAMPGGGGMPPMLGGGMPQPAGMPQMQEPDIQAAIGALGQSPEAPPEEVPPQRAFLGRLFAGDQVEGLSKDQNKKLRQQALLQAGLTVLGAPRGNAVQALAMGVLQARQATAQTAGALLDEKAMQRRLVERRAVLQDSDLTPIEQYEELLRIASREGDKEQQDALRQILKDAREAEELDAVEINGQTFYKDAEGNTFEPGTKREVTEAIPQEIESPMLADLLNLYGIDPATAPPEVRMAAHEMWKEMEGLKGDRTTVNVGEDKLREGIDEIGLRRLEAAFEQGEAAQQTLVTIGQARVALEDAPQGRLEGIMFPLRRAASAFGAPVSKAASAQEVATAVINQMLLDRAAQMSGVLSDNDILFLERQGANLENTAEANKMILDMAERVAQFRIDQAIEKERYIVEGQTGAGLFEHMVNWAEQYLDGEEEDDDEDARADAILGGG